MNRLVLAIVAAGCVAGAAPAAFAATDAECAAEWTKAYTNNDGVLSGVEANRYLAYMRIRTQASPDDGSITQAKFMDACKGDIFRAAAPDPGAPLKGTNSFTEVQAKDRVVAAGYTDVTALTMDEAGIWRGNAKRGDQTLKIAVDYKGNVISQ